MSKDDLESIEKEFVDKFQITYEKNLDHGKLKTGTINEREAVYVSMNVIKKTLTSRSWNYFASLAQVDPERLSESMKDPKIILTKTNETPVFKLARLIVSNFSNIISLKYLETLKCFVYPGYIERRNALTKGDKDSLEQLVHRNLMDWYLEKTSDSKAIAFQYLHLGFNKETVQNLSIGEDVLKLARNAVETHFAYEKEGYFKFYSDTFENKYPNYMKELNQELWSHFIKEENRGINLQHNSTQVFYIENGNMLRLLKYVRSFLEKISKDFCIPYFDKRKIKDEKNTSVGFIMVQAGIMGEQSQIADYEDEASDVDRVSLRTKKKAA